MCCRCSFIVRHPLIYCPDCGGRLIPEEISDEEYRKRMEKSFNWLAAKYDPISGQKLNEGGEE